MATFKKQAEFPDVLCLAESDLALRVKIDGRIYWIPKGQVDEADSAVTKAGDEGVLVTSEWIAREKGLI
jgi:hypothetical protein